MSQHDALYDEPELYDLAFSYRNYDAECKFLRDIQSRWGTGSLESFIEVAAGPAGHALVLAKENIRCTALDLSEAMVRHGVQAATALGVQLRYMHADMAEFSVEEPHQMAACLIDSASYLLTNDAFLSHLDCVARALSAGGLYVLELAHPSELFGDDGNTVRTWTMESERGTLTVDWGRTGDYDVVTQCADVAVKMELVREDRVVQCVTSTSKQRVYTPNEVDALVRANGRFDIVAMYGALDIDRPLSGPERAWRMVPVLRLKP